ncbi:MAG: hypothetical protein JXA87_13430 [Thermoleophilia bacterium]|nr:hypothetical protein [Thermoleophilia bacterium]
MMVAGSLIGGRRGCQSGSILLLVLFMCLAVAVVVQAVSAVVLCAERSVTDESVGRQRLAEKDQGLATLRQVALTNWAISPWAVAWERAQGPAAARPVEGSLRELEGDVGWVMEAAVRQDLSVSALAASAWVERGRDGIDLPLAALVAETVSGAPGRSEPWLAAEGETGDGGAAAGTAVGYVVVPPDEPLLDEGCVLVELRERWRLDTGWAALESREDVEEQTAARLTSDGGDGRTPLAAVAPEPQVILMGRDGGRRLELSDEMGMGTPDQPLLVLVTGGAEFDAQGLGDLYGVLVVDDGSLLLDGTTVHGAVFATGSIDFGNSGRLLFSRAILRWATDRSLQRARLVPGTRWEGME